MEITLLLILSGVGTCLTLMVSLAPVPAMVRAHKSRSLQEVSHMFLLMNNINPLVWVFFSAFTKNVPILIANAISFVNCLVFLIWFHALNKTLWLFLGIYTLGITPTILLHLFVLPVRLQGVIGAVTNLLSFVAPLEQLRVVFQEKRASYIDMNVMVSTFASCLVWSTYGLITQNYFVLVPYTGGAFVTLVPIVAYFWAKEWLPHKAFAGIQQLLGDALPVADPLKSAAKC